MMMSCNGSVPMDAAPSILCDDGNNNTERICSRCNHPCPELLFIECGCKMHAMCVSTSTILKMDGEAKSSEMECPSCGKSASKGIYLYPIDIQSLERSTLSKSSNNNSINNMNMNMNDPSISIRLEEFYASIAPLFLLTWSSQSHSEIPPSSSPSSSDTQQHQQQASSSFINEDVCFRNGRWSTEEIQLVDAAMASFDGGELPISRGTTLNDFLRSLLLCKSTRLRKKIKNANFCTRTYSPKVTTGTHTHYSNDNTSTRLSNLHQKFISYIDEEHTNNSNNNNNNNKTSCDRHLLKFSMCRTWGMLFWKFCIDVGYTHLKADDWWKGLEHIEEKALAADNRRKQAARRKRVDSIPKTGIGGQQLQQQRGATAGADGDELYWGDTVISGDITSLFDTQMPSTTNTTTSATTNSHEILLLPDLDTTSLEMEDTGLTSQHSTIYGNHNNNINAHHQQHHQQQPQQQFPNNTRPRTNSPTSNHNDTLPPIQSKRARILHDIHPETPGNASDVVDISHKLADWNPFIEKVSRFLGEEQLPFQYFDVWIADTTTKTTTEEGMEEHNQSSEQECNSPKTTSQQHLSTSPSNKAISLRHVGHATNPDNDCIFTLYHMNEFGRYSSNFMFAPGIGLPGRVYTTGLPTWDDCVQDATLNDFPRVNGARSHGVKKALGIPLAGRSEGEIIVIALYCNDVITKDESLVQKCCMEFQRYQPKVKWELVLDIGNASYASENTLALPSLRIDGADDAVADSMGGGSTTANTAVAQEEMIVDLLGRYAPIETDPDSSSIVTNLLQSFTSLRLLLLRTQSQRSDEEIGAIDMLKRSYGHYLQSGRKENEIATLLANDWMVLRADFNSKPRQAAIHPIAMNMHGKNYAYT